MIAELSVRKTPRQFVDCSGTLAVYPQRPIHALGGSLTKFFGAEPESASLYADYGFTKPNIHTHPLIATGVANQ